MTSVIELWLPSLVLTEIAIELHTMEVSYRDRSLVRWRLRYSLVLSFVLGRPHRQPITAACCCPTLLEMSPSWMRKLPEHSESCRRQPCASFPCADVYSAMMQKYKLRRESSNRRARGLMTVRPYNAFHRRLFAESTLVLLPPEYKNLRYFCQPQLSFVHRELRSTVSISILLTARKRATIIVQN